MSAPDSALNSARENGLPSLPAENSRVPRRVFFAAAGVLGAGYAALLGYPVYRYLASPIEKAAEAGAITEVALPEAGKLPKGTALMFKFGARPALLIHHEDDTWTSFSAVCTHLGCTVQYQPDKRRIFCACHGGTYNPISGKPVAGPPPKGLTAYRVETKDGQIIIHRS